MFIAASALLAFLHVVAAQTWTSCNPTKQSCPADPGFDQATTTYNFQQTGIDNTWNVINSGDKISQDSNGLHFIIDAEGESPTLATKQYLFFGTVTATLEAAAGAGIVSAFILQSDDLDEIDWEWLGGATTDVQSNYFSKGDTSSYDRGATHAVSNPQTSFHTYAINWTPDAINWIIDGTVVRTLKAASVGNQYPQTPMQVRIGTWCGGCSGEPQGTVQWAGGPTTFSGASYVMTITSLEIDNANPAGSYTYGDRSGSASSIVIGGAVSLPQGNSSASGLEESRPASIPASSVASPIATDPPSTPSPTSPQTDPTAAGITAITVNIGPTSTHLAAIESEASKISMAGIVAVVIGAILLMVQY